jgi:hypothetical protein
MARRILLVAFSTLIVGACQTADARLFTLNSDAVSVAQSPTADLQSAFYLRGSGRDHAVPAVTSAALQTQLRRHFTLVLATLAANSERSLAVAVARLERARGESWTGAERSTWRNALALRRLENLRRLRLYQLRGRFPHNEHVADRAVPIFVDNHDTACAVGHLMRESGWNDAVAAIQRANNFVYVTDVRNGPLVDWVLVSGLTQEEAALIQPGYYPPPFDVALDELTQGGSMTKNGLHFDNFHFIAGALTDPDSFPESPPPTNQVNLATFGAAVRQGVFHGTGLSVGPIDPIHEDWLFVGARSDFYTIHPRNSPWGVLYSYDVAPVDPDDRLVGASLESFAANWNFLGNGVLDVETRIYAGGSTATPALADLALSDSEPGGFFVGEDSASFAPQGKITVFTAAKLEGDAAFTSLVHSFERAPEPVSDFDSDGDVDGADFLAWQKGVGLENPTLAQGDANRDGQADAADLDVWKQQFFGIVDAAIDSVPEPTAAILCAFALIGIRASNRRY